ncbi:MAG: ATP-binding protein [Planctomycetota bacterium]|jgi:PAS domain S-box-containing protein
MNILVVIKGPHRGQRYILEDGILTLGRDKRNDIPFEDEGVSRKHIQFSVRNLKITIEDMGSTNGTYVNNLRIQTRQELHNGDRIALGNTIFLVKLDSPAAEHRTVVSEKPHQSSSMIRMDMASSSVVDLMSSANMTMISGPDEGQHSFLSLYNFITRISGILDTGQLLDIALEEAVNMCRADRGAIILLNNKGELDPRSTFSKNNKEKVIVSRTLVDEVLNHRKGILSSEAAKDKRYKHTTAISIADINSMCCVPLLVKDKVLGVAYVDSTVKSKPLNEYSLRLLTAMALELSICVENASLYNMLKDSEEFSSCVITSMAGGLIIADTDAKIVRLNNSAAEIAGLPIHEINGKNINAIPAYEELNIIFGQTLKSGRPQENESLFIYNSAGNARIPVGVNTAILEDYAGSPIGVVIHFRDLTHIHKLSEQVKRAERLGALGQMASGIAHEIRNPLNSVQGFVQLLQENAENEQHKEYCHIVLDEVKRINGIVQDMLDFSRQQEFSTENTDIEKILHEVCRQLHGEAEKQEIDLSLQVTAKTIPQVRANADKLKQVLINIIRNGLQATPAGGRVTAGLDIYSSESSPFMVRISITDTGSGIDKENLSKVFDPFYTTKDDGTGLGLSICQKIVEQHGGRINVESVLTEGTSFFIFLPPAR